MTNAHDDLIAEAMAATEDGPPPSEPGKRPEAEQPRSDRPTFKEGLPSIILAVLAAGAALAVHEIVPNDVENLGSFLFALVPFVLAVEAVALFPRSWSRIWWLPALAATLCFVVVMGVFAPRMFASHVNADFDAFYALMRMLVPFVILSLALALRLGGGSGGVVRRASYASLLVMLSGLEDLMFQVWEGNPIPDKWEWAEHITVRLGHVASSTEAFIFIGAHLVLALLILFVPTPKRFRSTTS